MNTYTMNGEGCCFYSQNTVKKDFFTPGLESFLKQGEYLSATTCIFGVWTVMELRLVSVL